MPDFSSLLQRLTPDGPGFVIEATPDWLQGRTLYGGLSAALCLEATLRSLSNLPPLRSAHFSFAGPASGSLSVCPTVLRQGKSSVSVGVDLSGDVGFAVRGILTFGAARASALSYLDIPAPASQHPDACVNFLRGGGAPIFMQHFDMRQAGEHFPVSGAPVPDLLLWVRHHETSGADPIVALLALADAPPPAAMAMFDRPAPISTITWAINIIAVPSHAGWRLIRSRGESVADGYASQNMTIWDETGAPLITAQQNVAVFI
ncbi:thioesterase family protein [Lichenicoccus sp.]|uniref:thioesterase family protein n=1 Tax=Lichenicoccus sp. TaxID=2781899 RepID=UPI003D14810E